MLLSIVLLCILCFNHYVHCKAGSLKILSPDALVKELGAAAEDVDFTLANFGEAPYGKTLLGEIILSQPKDSCQLQEGFLSRMSTNHMKIVMADRGNCTFVTKAHNAQMSGASVLLIVNNQDPFELGQIVMVDDNSGQSSNLRIPTVMINGREGDIIKKFLKDNEQEDSQNADVVMMMLSFDWPSATKADVDVWISAADKGSYDFLEDLHDYLSQLDQKFWDFKVHYVLWHCLQCSWEDYKTEYNTNCVSGGRYCAPDPDEDGPLSGRDVVLESLTQTCIMKHYKEKWWTYMQRFSTFCLKSSSKYVVCSENIMDTHDIDKTVIKKCVDEGFEGDNKLIDNNRILDEQKTLQEANHVLLWPSVIINNYTYRVKLQGVYSSQILNFAGQHGG
eukprot:TRINITY_DN9029_c0_g1_i4.p1 TRINITY_DN9029_c0_g1~~TRINITY_DN9029_c0_g1_i4.p1  ORF type:complete len:391 (-),score=68.50 TRINITY_DN9029_c0_g1_i4:513-1685(-)